MGKAQNGPSDAKLDDANQAIPGKDYSIESQFEMYPLVEPSIAAHHSNNDHFLAAAMVVTNSDNPIGLVELNSLGPDFYPAMSPDGRWIY